MLRGDESDDERMGEYSKRDLLQYEQNRQSAAPTSDYGVADGSMGYYKPGAESTMNKMSSVM